MSQLAARLDPVHWSKDFVEHLRTVHFALIAIAVGLVILVLSSKQYNAVSALVQIEEILDLKRHWSPAWMEQFGEQDKSSKATHSNLDTFLEENLKVSWKDPGFDGVIYWKGPNRRVEVTCVFPKDNWYWSDADASPTKYPETLSEFKKWWEGLKQSYVIYLPDQISDSGTVLDLGKSVKSGKDVSLADFRAGSAGVPTMKFQLSLDPDREDLTEENAGQAFFYTAYLERHQMLQIPILSLGRYVVSRDTITRHYHNLQVGDFTNTFADLASASETTSDLSLEDIKEFIHDEAAKGPEVFEVFGMKFPAGQVTLWGIVLLLSVELYLFTYLRQLSGKLAPDDPGWDVPWIAMDIGKLSQSIFFVTLVPLPVAALTLLAARRATSLFIVSSDRSASFLTSLRSLDWSGRAEVVILLLSCVASLALALLCWKYRPQLKEGSLAPPNENVNSQEPPSSKIPS